MALPPDSPYAYTDPNAARMEAERRRQAAAGQGGSALPLLGAYGGYKGISALLEPSIQTPGNIINSSIATQEAVGATAIPNAAASPFALGGFGSVGNVYAPALGAIGAYDLLKHDRGPVRGALQGAASGAAIGSTFGAPWLGAGIGGAIGLGKSFFGGGKDADQMARDSVRANLQKNGFLDQDWNVDLAKGGKFNIGLDGSSKAYNVDSSNPFNTQAVGWVDPIANLIANGDRKLHSDFAGYLANAAMSDASSLDGVRANVLNFVKKLGLDQNSLNSKIDELRAKGVINDNEYAAYKNSVMTMFKGDPKLYVNGPIQQQAAPQTPASAAPQAQPAQPTPPGGVQQLQTKPAGPTPQINPQTVDPGFNRRPGAVGSAMGQPQQQPYRWNFHQRPVVRV